MQWSQSSYGPRQGRKRTRKAIDAEGQDTVLQASRIYQQRRTRTCRKPFQGRPGETFEASMMRMMTVVMKEVGETSDTTRLLL